jgi:hypothetical protein
MTKQNNTSVNTDLVSLKLAVIKFHKANEYTEGQIARDACFTSNNGINWKKGQMADVAAEIRELAPRRGSEIVNVQLDRLMNRHEGMEAELHVLEERHKADLEVYKTITGETWIPRPKRTHKSDGLGLDDRLAKFA